MAKYNCLVASKIFDHLKNGEASAVAYGKRWSDYVQMDNTDIIVPYDEITLIDAENAETLSAVVLTMYVIDGVTLLNLDIVEREKVYVIDGIPKVSLNQLYSKAHWGYRKNAKDLMATRIWKVMGKERIYYKCDVEYTFLFKSNNLDATNCNAMVKMIEDIIVINDAPLYIRSNKVTPLLAEKEVAKDMLPKECTVIIKIKY